MPFYDYECTVCSIEFTAFQRLDDVPYLNCPECRGALRPLFQVQQVRKDKVELQTPQWQPDLTDVHKGWSDRRKWKHGPVKSLLSCEDKKLD